MKDAVHRPTGADENCGRPNRTAPWPRPRTAQVTVLEYVLFGRRLEPPASPEPFEGSRMEGSEPRRASAKVLLAGHDGARITVDVVRFVLGGFFIVVGVGLVLEGIVGMLYAQRLFLFQGGESPALEFFVGLVGIVVGGGVIKGMSRTPGPETGPPR